MAEEEKWEMWGVKLVGSERNVRRVADRTASLHVSKGEVKGSGNVREVVEKRREWIRAPKKIKTK